MKRSLLLRLLAVLALILPPGFTTAARADKAPPPALPPLELPVPDSILKEPERTWLGLYINGTKSGWAEASLGPATVEGKACIAADLTMTLELKALSKVIKTTSLIRKCYSVEPPFRAFYIEKTQTMGKQEHRMVVRQKEGTSYTAESTEAGSKRTQEVKDLDVRLCQETTMEVWAADPLRKAGDSMTSAGFSFERLANDLQTITAVRQDDWTGPGGKIPVWELNLHDHDDGIDILLRLSRVDGTMVNGGVGSTMEMRVEPEEVAKVMPGEQPDLFLAMTIGSDRKLGKSTALTELIFELTAPEGKTVPNLPDTANQTVERKADGRVIVTTGSGKPQPASDTERAESLQATSRYPLADETVKKLAAEAVNGASDDRSKVEKLLQFTDSYIRDSVSLKALTVMDVIKSKKGDCTAHSLLFTTLARASGIPAREAGGWMYMGNDYQAFGGHAWDEVILDGHWVPVDPTWTEMPLDAGHIQECVADPNGSKHINLDTGLKAKIISFKTK